MQLLQQRLKAAESKVIPHDGTAPHSIRITQALRNKEQCWCCTVCTHSRGTLKEWLPCDGGPESLAAHERA